MFRYIRLCTGIHPRFVEQHDASESFRINPRHSELNSLIFTRNSGGQTIVAGARLSKRIFIIGRHDTRISSGEYSFVSSTANPSFLDDPAGEIPCVPRREPRPGYNDARFPIIKQCSRYCRCSHRRQQSFDRLSRKYQEPCSRLACKKKKKKERKERKEKNAVTRGKVSVSEKCDKDANVFLLVRAFDCDKEKIM